MILLLILVQHFKPFTIVDISIQELSETRKKATVTISANAIQEEENKLLQKHSKKMQLPGFRKGKVPVSLIRQKFQKELAGELKQNVVSRALQYINETASFEIYQVIDLKFDTEEVAPNEEAIITFTIDVKPKVELPEYRQIPIKMPKATVSEEEIDDSIKKLRDQRAEFVKIDEPANKGDYVKLSYEGKLGEDPIKEIVPHKPMFGHQHGTWEEAGSTNEFSITAITDALIGMKAGDMKTVYMTFPENFEEPVLANKEATYTIDVQEVRKKIVPELNQQFLEKIKVGSIEELRQKLKSEFLRQKKQSESSKGMDQIVKYLDESTKFPLPESAIEIETDTLLRNFMTRMLNQGASYEEFEKQKHELIEKARAAATSHAKTSFILNAIAKKENIQIDQNDLNQRITQEAYMAGMKPQDFVNSIKNDRARIEELKQASILHKVLDFLFQQSKVEYVETADSKKS